jgi:hypothetical protein
MGKIYVGANFKLNLLGSVDIAGGTAVIQYLKPGETVAAEVPATILDVPTCLGQGAFTPAINDTPGMWRFWLKPTFADASVAFGETFRLRIYPVGA